MKSLNLGKPHLIVVVGIPGSGKTFFARQFSDTFNAPYLRSQDLLQFSENPDVLMDIWDYMLDKLVSTKQTLLIEGFGATRSERHQLNALARQHGYQPLYIWVQTEPVTAETRARRGNGKQKPEFPLSEQDFQDAVRAFEPLTASDPYMVISGKHTYASQAKNVLKKLAEPRAKRTKITPEDRPDIAPVEHRGRITIN